MSPLTDRQRNLLTLANQLSLNLINTPGNNSGSNSGLNTDVSVDLPGLDLDVDLNLGRRPDPSPPTPPAPPTPPTTIREVLLSLVNEQVAITTPFDVVSGTLIAVRDDYIVVIENTGAQALIRIDKIELVSEL